jgi:hypothetical protein
MWHTVSFWSEIPIWSFPKTQIPFVIRIEPQGAKNKNFKPQVPKGV